MKIYIASKYIEHNKINRKIFHKLSENGFDVFLPESINIEGKTNDEMYQIGNICYKAIDSSDVILVVSPIGDSVSAEIGYSINNKIKFSNTTIIFFRYTNACKEKEDNEAMIVPFLDYKIDATSHNVNSALDELIVILNSIKN